MRSPLLFQTQSKASLQSSFLLLRNVKKEAADGGAVAPAGVAVTAEHQGGRAVKCGGSWLATAGEGTSKQLGVVWQQGKGCKIERGREKVEGRD